MENLIIDKINSATNMKEAERIAEDLTYEISYEHKKDSWRIRYEWIKPDDFVTMGYRVIVLNWENDSFREWLFERGVASKFRNKEIYFDSQSKLMFIKKNEWVSIDCYPHGEPKELFSLEDYKSLLIHKLLELLEKRKLIQKFIDSLVREHKDFLDDEKNEMIKQQIIEEALEKARQEKLII